MSSTWRKSTFSTTDITCVEVAMPPAEAAAEQVFQDTLLSRAQAQQAALSALAAAAPHIRAQVLDEVQAALRDDVRWMAWVRVNRQWDDLRSIREEAADYLRDTLGAGGEDR